VKPGWRRVSAIQAAALLAVLGGAAAEATADEQCNVRLTVELTPDVPDANADGFLSSLLGNHPAYRLELLREDDDSVVELGLSGPGSEYHCQSVIEMMRRDGRVVSIHVNSPSSVATKIPAAGESRDAQASQFGLGALNWAVHHPRAAWRILLPIQSNDTGAEASGPPQG
jgi:hypothetical protein